MEPWQEKKGGCKWVQHLITGKCQWLPDHAVANPWIEIAEGTCPVKTRPSATPMNTIVVVTPKVTSLVVETSTCTPKPTSTKYITVPSNTPTSPPAVYPTATLEPKKSDKQSQADPTSTPVPTYYCDQCSVESAHATNDAEMLHAVETLKAYIMRP